MPDTEIKMLKSQLKILNTKVTYLIKVMGPPRNSEISDAIRVIEDFQQIYKLETF